MREQTREHTGVVKESVVVGKVLLAAVAGEVEVEAEAER